LGETALGNRNEVSYEWLDRWAERDQRRIETASERARDAENVWWARGLAVLVALIVVATRVLFFMVGVTWIVSLLAHPSVSHYVLAVVLVMIVCMSAFTSAALISARRSAGRNPFTGLPRKRRLHA
jgi:hypothetical protein